MFPSPFKSLGNGKEKTGGNNGWHHGDSEEERIKGN